MSRRSFAVISCCALVAVVAAACLPKPVPPDTDAHPVILVHGHTDAVPPDCTGRVDLEEVWRPTVQAFRAAGWRSEIWLAAYYACDEPWVDTALGVKTLVVGDGQATSDKPIEDIARDFAHAVHTQFSAPGKRVEVLAHSMGGLVVRSALTLTGADPTFPPFLFVDDVATLGSPHLGASAQALQHVCNPECADYELSQMQPTSTLLSQTLRTDHGGKGLNPQGAGGTAWTLVSASGDWHVTAASGAGFDDVGGHHLTPKLRVAYIFDAGLDHAYDLDAPRTTSDAPAVVWAKGTAPGDGVFRSDARWPVLYAESELRTTR